MAGGQSSTLQTGSVVGSVTLALIGAAIAFSAGTLEPSTNGQKATFSQGTATVSASVALTGASTTAGQGTATPNSDGTVPLVGEASTGSAGTVAPSWEQALAGSESTSAAGTAGVSVRPTDIVGQSVTASAGTVDAGGSPVTVNISGVEATFADGIVTGGTQFITGTESTSAAGTAAVDVSKAITGEAITSAQGVVSSGQEADDTYLLSSIGSMAGSLTVAITGSEATFAAGTVTVSGDSFYELTGAAITSETGTIDPGETYPLGGASMTSAQYPMGAPGGAALSGAEVSVVAGDVFTTNDRTFALTGQEITSAAGSTFASPLAFVAGQELTVSAQEIGPRGVTLTGSEVAVSAGYVTVPTVRQKQGRGTLKRNYLYKGARYWLTNEELLRLIAQDIKTVTREDIKVSYKDKKPHVISKAIWSEIKAEAVTQNIQMPTDDEDIEAIIALL